MFIILILILILIVFENEQQTVAVAKAVGIENGKPITVIATDVDVAGVAIDDISISVILSTLIYFLYLLNFLL